MRKLLSTILIGAALLTNVQCTKDQLCAIKAICDLISKTAIATGQIKVGTVAAIGSIVLNIAAPDSDCTDDAPSSQSSFGAIFRESVNQPWQVVADLSQVYLDIRALKADGAEDSKVLELLINQAGQYRFLTIANHDFRFDERDLLNNESCEGCLIIGSIPSNNISYSEILTVIPDPEFELHAGTPQILIVNIRDSN